MILDFIQAIHDDGEFGDAFCAGCEAIRDDGDIGAEWCSEADYDYTNSRCVRRHEWEEIKRIANDARREALDVVDSLCERGVCA
jgi:hypothetical protein